MTIPQIYRTAVQQCQCSKFSLYESTRVWWYQCMTRVVKVKFIIWNLKSVNILFIIKGRNVLIRPLCTLLDSQFLHRPFCRAEGLCHQAAIQVLLRGTPNGPIRAKTVNQSSSVIGWQNRGQTGTSECTVVQCRVNRDWTKVKMYSSRTDPSTVCAPHVCVGSVKLYSKLGTSILELYLLLIDCAVCLWWFT